MRPYEPADDEMFAWSRDAMSPVMHENFPKSAQLSVIPPDDELSSPQMPPFAFETDHKEPAHF